MITPLALFVCFYLATFWILLWSRLGHFQWLAVASASTATLLTILLWNHGQWDLGLSPRFAGRELAVGAACGVVLIGCADVLIVSFTPLRHVRGNGFPVLESLAVYVPAALHEELVFRGYPYQLLRRVNRIFAIAMSSLVFAALHSGNEDVTLLGLVNVGLGGVILALAYERYRRLWMPIGLHFAWNMMSGPVLGYDVSGFTSRQSLLLAIVKGPPLLTGGDFGIEGSILMTVTEIAAAAVLWRRGMLNVQC
ncbi:MAG TPA: CPBP family intramembrane glutamic endopeptidase [Thermoanaerobaculia bacterium]